MEVFEAFNLVFDNALAFNNAKRSESIDLKSDSSSFSNYMKDAVNNKYQDREAVRPKERNQSSIPRKYKAFDTREPNIKKEISKIDDARDSISLIKNETAKTELKENEENKFKDEKLKELEENLEELLYANGGNLSMILEIQDLLASLDIDLEELYDGVSDDLKALLMDMTIEDLIGQNKLDEIEDLIAFIDIQSNEDAVKDDISILIENLKEQIAKKEMLVPAEKGEGNPKEKAFLNHEALGNINPTSYSIKTDMQTADFNAFEDDTEKIGKEDQASISKDNTEVIEEGLAKQNGILFEDAEGVLIEEKELSLEEIPFNHSSLFSTERLNLEKPIILAENQMVSKEDLIQQIMDKAKFISKEGFSEIKVQLKPEALGKLTLNLILDKGEMTARFMVENYQVKEIIESNFTELRDALDEKGINIQNIDVSVGQNQQKPGEEHRFKPSKNQSRILSKKLEEDLSLDGNAYAEEELNPYSIKESDFDTRA